MAERIFNLEEAERLLPQLERWLRTVIEARKEIAAIELEYARMVGMVSASGGRVVDIVHFIRRKEEREEWGVRLQGAAEEIENCGCVLKDIEIGLVDFPCEMEEREVYLCWKLGEPSIAFWHGTDEGFAGRKPIDTEFLERLKPSRPI